MFSIVLIISAIPTLGTLSITIFYCTIHDIVVTLQKIKSNNIMKKAFILALFILGMCNASVFGMAQEIILTELYSIMPMDGPDVFS